MRPAERSPLRRRSVGGGRPFRAAEHRRSRGTRDRWLLIGVGLLLGLLTLTWFDVGSGPAGAASPLHAAR